LRENNFAYCTRTAAILSSQETINVFLLLAPLQQLLNRPCTAAGRFRRTSCPAKTQTRSKMNKKKISHSIGGWEQIYFPELKNRTGTLNPTNATEKLSSPFFENLSTLQGHVLT